MRSTSLHEFQNILYTSYIREMCEGTELKALRVGDCNFTHGVTHRSTLHLSAYFLATGSLPRYILSSLFVAPSPMCFAFVRWMYKCNHIPWNIHFCSSLLFRASYSLSLLFSHLFTLLLLLSSAILCDKQNPHYIYIIYILSTAIRWPGAD